MNKRIVALGVTALLASAGVQAQSLDLTKFDQAKLRNAVVNYVKAGSVPTFSARLPAEERERIATNLDGFIAVIGKDNKISAELNEAVKVWQSLSPKERVELLAGGVKTPGGDRMNWAAAAFAVAVVTLAHDVATCQCWVGKGLEDPGSLVARPMTGVELNAQLNAIAQIRKKELSAVQRIQAVEVKAAK